jgi:alkanesulfonate monooxygenase SsuD/methylene tetrahydromethanopterin reductase-like flavin-dependent oxidoreductase (luciferase family)
MTSLEYGFVFPAPDPAAAVEAAVAAETAGWDGFFMWESVWGADPWVTLGAIAARTRRIRIGTMLTPLPIRRPWKVAAETATLDVLSGGRLILAVGLGAPDTGFAAFGLPTGRRTRAELLDEGLAVLTGLWAGQPFGYPGRHYRLEATSFTPAPPPVQRRDGVPHIPIWVVGAWGRPASMRRVLRCDGMLPHMGKPDGTMAALDELPLTEMRAWLDEHAPPGRAIDLVVEGKTPGDDPGRQAEIVGPLAASGATWWIEALWDGDAAAVSARIEQGPPRRA